MKKTIAILLFVLTGLPLFAQVVYSDNEWRSNCITFAADNNRVIPEPTAFRVNVTDKALIVEMKMEGNHWKMFQSVPFKKVTNQWPSDESVEVFLDPGRSCAKYVQLAAGLSGTLFDSRYVKKTWAAKWRVERKDFKGGSFLKFIIPYDADLKKPETGDVWGFNICRNVKGPSVYYTTFAKVGAVFNTPSKFAELRIGTEKTFAAANQAKNMRQFASVAKEINALGLQKHFAPHIAGLKKHCDELSIQAVKDELRLMKAMKECK